MILELRLWWRRLRHPMAALRAALPRWLPLTTRLRLLRLVEPFRPRRTSPEPVAVRVPRRLPRAGPSPKPAIVCLPLIAWELRRQRPQELFERLAVRGWPILYADQKLDPRLPEALLSDTIAPAVHRLQIPGKRGRQPVHERFDLPNLMRAAEGLRRLAKRYGLRQAVVLCQAPGWGPLARWVKRELGWRLVYDRMDRHAAFPHAPAWIEGEECALMEEADLVVASSTGLAVDVPGNTEVLELPNACDPAVWAAATPSVELDGLPRPIVGYFGAISAWFDTDLVVQLALRKPDWSFVLVGSTRGSAADRLEQLPNVHLLGERPHDELPPLAAGFDAALVPFLQTPLVRATDPVKVYEMLAAGLPVVATPMPELEKWGDLVATASTSEELIAALESAIETRHEPDTVSRRRAVVEEHTWDHRVDKLEGALEGLFPLVSILIVTHGRRNLTELCLDSIEAATEYPNYEIIVVDNASPDDTPVRLEGRAHRDPRLTVIRNAENEGFPAACNQAARAAKGEILCLLNNDTVVTRGWLSALVTQLERDASVGLVGATSNGVGNEARVRPGYSSLEDLQQWAMRRRRERFGRSFSISTVALCCGAIRKVLWEHLGGLDEAFGPGLFEDDDLACRVRREGYDVRCVEDAYVHHWQGATFDQLPDQERHEMYERNRRLFLAKRAAQRGTTHRIYDSAATRGAMLDVTTDLPRYSGLLRLLISTNIKTRYKRSLLGVLWTLLNPLLNMAVLTIAFSALFASRLPDYPIYVLAGLIFWAFFQQTTTHCTNQLVWGSKLLAKVYIPAAVFPLSAAGTGLVNLALSIVPLIIIALVVGHPITAAWLFLPVSVLLLALFSLGLGLFLSSVAVVFTDVVEMWTVVVRVWYFLTPVMYPETILPAKALQVVRWNPLYHLITCFRDPIYLGVLPPLRSLAIATAYTVLTFAAGWAVFAHRQHEFALRA